MYMLKRCDGCDEKCGISFLPFSFCSTVFFPMIGGKVIRHYVGITNERYRITGLPATGTDIKPYEVCLGRSPKGEIRVYYGSDWSAKLAGEKIARLCDKYHSADASKMPKGFYQGKRIKDSKEKTR